MQSKSGAAGRRQIDERLATAPTPRDALMLAVARGRSIAQAYDAALASEGISLSQVQLLTELARRGPELGAEAFLALLDELCVMADCAAQVEREGWLERDHDGVHRITGPGRALLARIAPIMEDVDDELSAQLGSDELDSLLQVLHKLGPTLGTLMSNGDNSGSTRRMRKYAMLGRSLEARSWFRCMVLGALLGDGSLAARNSAGSGAGPPPTPPRVVATIWSSRVVAS